MQEDIFFINERGEKISLENVMSHIGIANKILEQDNKMNEEFLNSGKSNPIDFLISTKGYIAVSQMQYYKSITYDSAKLPENNKRFLQYYKEEGYSSTDFEAERKKLERGEY